MSDEVTIRAATEADAPRLLEIYAPYVRETAITFEYDVPSIEEFAARIRRTIEAYPYLVAEKNGRAVGYAYAGPFHERAAYAWAAEVAVYVAMDERKRGIGKALYEALESCLSRMNILNAAACIAYPTDESDALTKNSAEFHAHLGYRMVGMFRECGYKFDRWYNMVWMEKHLKSHDKNPKPVVPFPQAVGFSR